MYKDMEWNGERIGGYGLGENREDRNRNEYAERWQEVMKTGVPEYSGESWSEEPSETSANDQAERQRESEEFDTTDVVEAVTRYWQDHKDERKGAREEVVSDWREQWLDDERPLEDELADAAKIKDYGFDTACRVYGLRPVLNAIVQTEGMEQKTENLLGEVYQKIAPSADERVRLYNEMQKDWARDNSTANARPSQIGFSRTGNFYDKTMHDAQQKPGSVEAIHAVQKVMTALETNGRFDQLREQAYERDQGVEEFLTADFEQSVISQVLEQVDAMVNDKVMKTPSDEAGGSNNEQGSAGQIGAA